MTVCSELFGPLAGRQQVTHTGQESIVRGRLSPTQRLLARTRIGPEGLPLARETFYFRDGTELRSGPGALCMDRGPFRLHLLGQCVSFRRVTGRGQGRAVPREGWVTGAYAPAACAGKRLSVKRARR